MAKKSLKAVCGNCQTKTKLEELAPIKDLWKRMDPGGQVPDGECPKCGALAYLPAEESWPQGEELLPAAEAVHRWLCRADLGRQGTTMAGKLARAIDVEKKSREDKPRTVSLDGPFSKCILAVRAAHEKLKFQAEGDAGTNDGEHDAGGDLRDELNALYEVIGIKEISTMAKRDLQETVEYALGVLNKACQDDEAINQNKTIGKAMAALNALAGKDNRPQVLIEVSQGMLEIVTEGNVPVIVYDFDDIKQGDAASYPKEPAEMVKDFEKCRLDCEKRRRECLSAGDETCSSCDADVLNAPFDGCKTPDAHSTEG